MMTPEITEAAKIRMQLHDVFALLAGAGTPAIRAEREAADTTTEMGNPEVAPDCRARSKEIAASSDSGAQHDLVCCPIDFSKDDLALYRERINMRLLDKHQSARATTFWALSRAARSILDVFAKPD